MISKKLGRENMCLRTEHSEISFYLNNNSNGNNKHRTLTEGFLCVRDFPRCFKYIIPLNFLMITLRNKYYHFPHLTHKK